jgi:hypothetical protein
MVDNADADEKQQNAPKQPPPPVAKESEANEDKQSRYDEIKNSAKRLWTLGAGSIAGRLSATKSWLFRTNSNHVIAIGTVVAAVAAIAYAITANRTLDIMQQQLDAIRVTIYQNRELVRQSIRQTKAAETSSNAAKSAAHTAEATLTSSGRSFFFENRPYVVVDNVAFIDTPRPEVKMRARVNFINAGKTPALDVRAFGIIVTADTEEDAIRVLKDRRPTGRIGSSIGIGPGGATVLEFAHSSGYSKEQAALIDADKLHIYVLGIVTYRDIFENRILESGFCYFRQPNTLAGGCSNLSGQNSNYVR